MWHLREVVFKGVLLQLFCMLGVLKNVLLTIYLLEKKRKKKANINTRISIDINMYAVKRIVCQNVIIIIIKKSFNAFKTITQHLALSTKVIFFD